MEGNGSFDPEPLVPPSASSGQVLRLPLPQPYDFTGCVRGHGWYLLEPNYPTDTGLRRLERLVSGRTVLLDLSYDADSAVVVIAVDRALSAVENAEVLANVAWALRADEDLSVFYATCAARGGKFALAVGRGRLLRCPTLFEDAVKVVLTTNTTWRQTKAMVSRLVKGLGEPHAADSQLHAFPEPESILAAGEAYLLAEVRLGYRARSLLDLAARAAELERLRQTQLPTEELRRQLLTFRGIGPYAAATLLMQLGRYDYLAVDSELRSYTVRKYFAGVAPRDSELTRPYQNWGRWQYLGYWLDRWLEAHD